MTLAERVADVEWYHTLELAPGVVTPGWFDTRPVAAKVPLPADLSGRRCLDVGTFDGFWAFELERRGAAEVLAVDLLDATAWDWPHGSPAEVVEDIGARKAGGVGFELAKEALGSEVVRRPLSVYDLDPDDVGTFDLVYVGSLLLHLRDPVRALERVRAVCRGTMVLVDAVDVGLTARFPRRPVAELDGVDRPWWWKPNVAALARMVESAGFALEGRPRVLAVPAGPGQDRVPLSPAVLRLKEGRRALLRTRVGDPHAALSARPR